MSTKNCNSYVFLEYCNMYVFMYIDSILGLKRIIILEFDI